MTSDTQSRAGSGYFPGRAPIEAYGNGGFRFAGMSHKGSILCLADGIHAWNVAEGDVLSPALVRALFEIPAGIGFVLLGTGAKQVFPSTELRHSFRDAGIGLDFMDTGAACRTYNVLLGEGRPVAAALIAVA